MIPHSDTRTVQALRSDLALQIARHIRCSGQTQVGAAKRLAVPQPTLSRIMHGKVSPIHHDSQGVFAGLSNPFDATRYHSLVIKRETFHHPDFVVGAWTNEGEIMGVRHKTWPLHGVQFHPESFLTAEGPKLLGNFVALAA